MASFKVKIDGLKKLIERLESGQLKNEIERVVQDRAVAALVAQAIGDNFDKEGPGWAPLKASTIRYSVAKKMRKKLSTMTDKEIVNWEKLARKRDSDIVTPFRMILQKSRLLKRTVTTPGYTGSNKTATGSNIYKVEGTNLIWGSTLPYAGTMNNGDPKKNVPARKFLVIRDEWQKRLNEYIMKRWMQVIKAALKGE